MNLGNPFSFAEKSEFACRAVVSSKVLQTQTLTGTFSCTVVRRLLSVCAACLVLVLPSKQVFAQSADSVYVDENGMVTGTVEKVAAAPVSIGPGMNYLLDHPVLPPDGFMPGMNRLMVACRLGDSKKVMELLQSGESVTTMDLAGKTALLHALEAGKTAPVFLLLQKGADVFQTDVSGENVLHKAARNGLLEPARYFLRLGVNPDKTDKAGVTPLMLAAAAGQFDFCLILVQNGANPNLEDNNGNTALHAWAAGLIRRSDATSKIVVKKGRKKKSKKPVDEVPEEDPALARWKKLFKKFSFDVLVKNAEGLTAIEFARKAGREDISASLETIR